MVTTTEGAVTQAFCKLGASNDLNPIVLKAIKTRTKRWSSCPNQAMIDAKLTLNILFTYRLLIPPCVGFAFFQSICYGWITDKRFKNLPARMCVLCNQPGSEDCFYHYSFCHVLWNAYHKLGMARPRVFDNLQRHLLLLENDNNKQLRMAFLHAVMNAVHKLRHQGCKCRAEDTENMIRAIFRETLSRHSGLKQLFSEMWLERGIISDLSNF